MHRYLALLVTLPAACTLQIAGTDTTVTIKGRVQAAGQPVVGASVNAVDSSTTTNAQGEYTLTGKPSEDRVTVEVNAPGYAPTMSVVRRRAEVFQYHADIELFSPTTRTMPMVGGMDSFTVAAGGQEIGVSVPPGTLPPGSTLEVTAFPAQNGPGTMETTEGVDKLLQTGGMLYIRAVDSAGKPVPVGGDGIQISPGQMSEIGPTGETQGYSLDQRAVWAPQTMNSIGNAKTLAAREAGFWNCDRNYRTTCLKGVVKSSGKRCGGEKVRAGTTSGAQSDLYSQDTAGANGEFCVEGPQGLVRTLTVGSTEKSITFPMNAGSCRQDLSACKDIGTVTVSDSDCPMSCALDEVDTPTGCQKRDVPANTGGGGGSGSVNAAGFTCLGTQQCGSWTSTGSSGCRWRACACADAAGSCARGWYETSTGRVFTCGECTATCTSAAQALIAACQ